MLLVSLLLVNKKTEHVPITPKWIVSVVLAFLGSGLCSTFQQMQQKVQNQQYKNEFMIVALSVVIVSLLVMSLIKECREMGTLFKQGWWLGAIGGSMNGMINLFVMILGGLMPVSAMFSVISGGGLVFTFLLSLTIYKEKLSLRQYIGFALGVASVILLNL
jgi:multidrug transporter EmrE-like cation transporter